MKKTLLFVFLFTLMLTAVPVWAAPVDINTATAEQLAVGLKGIGPAKALAIVAYRSSHGPFQMVDDLARVKGIGMRIVDINREQLSLGARENPDAHSASAR